MTTFLLPTGSKLRTTKGQRFLLVREFTPASLWNAKLQDFYPNTKPVVRAVRGSAKREVALRARMDRNSGHWFMIDQMTGTIQTV